MTAPPYDADNAHHIGDSGDESGLEIGHAESLYDLWQEETQSVIGRDDAKIHQAERQDARVQQSLQHAVMSRRLALAFLGCEPIGKPAPFIVTQPSCISGLIGKIEQDHYRQ